MTSSLNGYVLHPRTGEQIPLIRRRAPGFLWGKNQERKSMLSDEEIKGAKKKGVFWSALDDSAKEIYNQYIGLPLLNIQELAMETGVFDRVALRILCRIASKPHHHSYIPQKMIFMMMKGIKHLPQKIELNADVAFDGLNKTSKTLALTVDPETERGKHGMGSAYKKFILQLRDHIDTTLVNSSTAGNGCVWHAVDHEAQNIELLKRYVISEIKFLEKFLACKNKNFMHTTLDIVRDSESVKDFAFLKEPLVHIPLSLLGDDTIISESSQTMPLIEACLRRIRWDGVQNLNDPRTYTLARFNARDLQNAEPLHRSPQFQDRLAHLQSSLKQNNTPKSYACV
ncbi:MAG: hypothetical protein ACOY3I_04820 [Verrucomicrobiota bacterium]